MAQFAVLKSFVNSDCLLKCTYLKKCASPFITNTRCISGKSQDTRQKRKQPGVKRCEGDYVRKGQVIVEQLLMHFHPGLNVHLYSKNNLKAMVDGRVMMTCEKINPKLDHPTAAKYYGNMSAPAVYKRFFHVIPFTQSKKFKLVDLI